MATDRSSPIAPPPVFAEYPKWVLGVLCETVQQEAAVRAQPPVEATVATALAESATEASQRRPAIIEAAKCISGIQTPSPQLVELIQRGADAIRGNIDTRKQYPTRAEIRQRIEAVQGAAKTLAAEFEGYSTSIRSYALISILLQAGLEQVTINSLADALPKLAKAADLIPENPIGQGNHKAFPNPGALTPHEMCACLVAYAWRCTRGTLPPHTNEKAQNACEAVWKATGSNRGSPSRWRLHLEAAKDMINGHPLNADRAESFAIFWHLLEELGRAMTA